jgi:hypothetical protein
MAAARTRVRGLGPDEVEKVRVSLAAGRKPRVMFTASAGQIAGQIGQVVALTDPAVSEEFVVVRFGRDELPFSPGDVELAPRGATVKKPAPVAEPARAEPEFLLGKPARTTSRRRGDSASLAAGPRGTDARVAHGQGAPAAQDKDAPAAEGTNGASPTRAGSAPAGPPAPRRAVADGGAPARKASRAGRGKAPANLTVTLAYAGGDWTVAAAQGAKSLAKPYLVKPAEALRMVSLVDVPGVQEAVEQILSAERVEAEQQAERLRAELAEIEARLAELRDAG